MLKGKDGLVHMNSHCIFQTKKESMKAFIEKNKGITVIYGAAFWGGLLAENSDFKIDYFCDKRASVPYVLHGIPVVNIKELENIINKSKKRATIIICVENKGTVLSIYNDLVQLDLNADVFDYFENEIVFSDSEFILNGKRYALFEHPYNCGYKHARMTERSVELSLAREYIDSCNGTIVEIGAVTPYYFFNNKIAEIIDPTDIHKRVTRKSIFDCDLNGKNVLSISTVEHIGTSDYGMHETENTVDAIEKILREADTCLITAPSGYNKLLDEWVKENQKSEIVKLMQRSMNNHWEEVTDSYVAIEYTHLWANGLVVIKQS